MTAIHRPSSINDGCPVTDKFAPDEERLAARLKALAHPARLRIVDVLAARGTCICGEIVEGGKQRDVRIGGSLVHPLFTMGPASGHARIRDVRMEDEGKRASFSCGVYGTCVGGGALLLHTV